MAVYLQAEEPKPHYLRSGQHSYAPCPLADIKFFFSESPDFNSQHESQSFRIYFCVSWKYSLLHHFHWLSDTSNLLQATEYTVNWRNTVCTKHSSFLLNVWTQCNSEIIQSSLHVVADSHFFTNQNNSFSCILVNICTIVQQNICTNVSLLKAKLCRKLKKIVWM